MRSLNNINRHRTQTKGSQKINRESTEHEYSTKNEKKTHTHHEKTRTKRKKQQQQATPPRTKTTHEIKRPIIEMEEVERYLQHI